MEDTDNGSNFVALKSPNTLGSSVTWTLPSADGSANQVIGTDGSGALSFLSTTSTLAGATDSDISSPTTGQVLVHDGSNSFDNVSLSGDVTLASSGAVTIGNDKVTTGKIANDAVDADKLASNAVVEASIVNDAVTAAKLASNAMLAQRVSSINSLPSSFKLYFRCYIPNNKSGIRLRFCN